MNPATAAVTYPVTGAHPARKLSTPLRSSFRPPAQLVVGYGRSPLMLTGVFHKLINLIESIRHPAAEVLMSKSNHAFIDLPLTSQQSNQSAERSFATTYRVPDAYSSGRILQSRQPGEDKPCSTFVVIMVFPCGGLHAHIESKFLEDCLHVHCNDQPSLQPGGLLLLEFAHAYETGYCNSSRQGEQRTNSLSPGRRSRTTPGQMPYGKSPYNDKRAQSENHQHLFVAVSKRPFSIDQFFEGHTWLLAILILASLHALSSTVHGGAA